MSKVTKKSLFWLEVVHIVALACFSSIQSLRHYPKADEIERFNKTHSFIWKCSNIECPPGHGLSVQCGKSVPMNQPINCIPCIERVSYSDTNDYSVCKGCKHCGKNQKKSGNCTVAYDYTKCLGCKERYYWDIISNDCHPCSVCCGNNDHEKECENSGLPPNEQCQETHSDCSHPPPTKLMEKGGKFQENTGPNKLWRTRNVSPGVIWVIIVGVIIGVFACIFMVLKKTDQMTHVQSILYKFFCCHTCWSQSNSGRNTMEFDEGRVQDKLLLDVEKGSYAEDGVREGALEKACAPNPCLKSKVKYFRQSSSPDRSVSEPRPELHRPHSHPGCPENMNEEELQSRKQRAQIYNYIEKAEHTATAAESEQDPSEERLPKCSYFPSIPVTSKELINTIAPSMNQATSTTGLNSTQMPENPQDFQDLRMGKRVRDIPIEFYSKICILLNVKRDASWDDFRLLGEKIGLNKDECELLGQYKNPTDVILKRFDSQKSSCIRKFRAILEEMDRFDVIEEIENWVRKEWLHRQTRDLITL